MKLVLFLQQGLDLDIILIELVLVVSGSWAEYWEGSRVNYRLQRVAVCAGCLCQLFFKGGCKFLLNSWKFQFVDVESFRYFLPLGSSYGLDVQIGFGDDEAVVCPTVRAIHGLGRSHVPPVLRPDDDVVDEMPVLRARVHP